MNRAKVTPLVLFTVLVLLLTFLIPACTDLGAWDILRSRNLDQLGSKRMTLTFNNSGQSESLIDFPVLVVLTPERTDDYRDFDPRGIDLRFVDPEDPYRLLDHEIELWDPSDRSFIWVKVPRIDAFSASDFIWLYFRNPELREGGENPRGVWSDYELVYHLSPHPQAEIFDSSPGAHHGQARETMPTLETAWIGDGFPVSNLPKRYIATPYREDLEQWTVEAWVWSYLPPRIDTTDHETASGPVLGTRKYDLIWDHPNGKGYVHCHNSSGSDFMADFGDPALSYGPPVLGVEPWNYLAGVYDASATLRAFKNGTAADTLGVAGPLAAMDENVVFIGGRPTSWAMFGIIDEVRIQGRARSAQWIKAQYLSMTDTFITYGGIEDLEP